MAQGPNGSQNKNVTIKPPIQPPLPNPSSSTPPPTTTPDPKLYYESYDVMTGVRIAATLGGFFGLMVILVLYKSKSKTEKALEDPDFTAAAVAEVEKEERQLQAVLEATAYQQLNPKRIRRSLDAASPYNAKAHHHNMRFSSIGGYSTLMEPPTRTHSRLPCLEDQDMFCEDEDKSFYNDVYYNGHLDVPRRPSNITCSSSGSSYLERRDSAVVLSLSTFSQPNRNNKSLCPPNEQSYDLYYPIDIRVTQPTPGGSPCGSDRALYDRIQQQQQQQNSPELHQKLAPLASISSCNSSLATDYYPEYDVQSYTSDSVFNDDDIEENTENEVDEQFSTDSDINSDDGAYYGRRNIANIMKKDVTLNAINNRNFTKSSSTLVEESGDTGGTEEMPQLSFTEGGSAITRKLSMSSGNIDSSRHQWTQETLF